MASMAAQSHGSGILSQTIGSSPCIKTVLPAKIRTPSNNDVVMVGHSSIQLREFLKSCELSEVLAHLELGVQILAAKVISAEAETISMEDAILSCGKDEVQYKIAGEQCPPDHPPQIVVLSLATGELMFLYARTSHSGSSRFLQSRQNVHKGVMWPNKLGKHLAVDTRSRALAVASAKGSLSILSLRSVDKLKSIIDDWTPRCISADESHREQRFIQVEGVVLCMDFLSSTPQEPHEVILLLIVASHGHSNLLLYKWDDRRPLKNVVPMRCSGQRLPAGDSFPHLLIPSANFTSFAVVTSARITFYSGITSSQAETMPVELPTSCDKLWVAWAKPIRHEQHNKENEDIFLIREDGAVRVVCLNNLKQQVGSINFQPGELGIQVDTAVCTLAGPPTIGGDILIVCGNTTEGGVYHFLARQKPRKIQPLPNWSPLHDMVVLDGTAKHPDCSSTLVTAGLRASHSCLAELRYGLEAQICRPIITFPEANMIDRIWVLQKRPDGRMLLLASQYEHSIMLDYDPTRSEDERILMVDGEIHPEICFDEATLAATILSHGPLLQITVSQVNLVEDTMNVEHSPVVTSKEERKIVCADILPSTSTYALAFTIDQKIFTLEVSAELTEGHTLDLDYVPVDIKLSYEHDTTFCTVASQDGNLHTYCLGAQRLEAVLVTSLQSLTNSSKDFSLSCLSIIKLPRSGTALVLCGSKIGQIMLLKLSIHIEEHSLRVELSLDRIEEVGDSTVHLRAAPYDPKSDTVLAIISCGLQSRLLRLYRNTAGLDYVIHGMYITDPFGESQGLSAIIAADFMPVTSTAESEGLLCVVGNDLLTLTIGLPTMLPRSVSRSCPSKHMVYIPSIKKCILSMPGCRNTKVEARDRPYLQIIDPFNCSDETTLMAQPCYPFGEPNETIRDIVYWEPTNGIVHFNMVIIGGEVAGNGRLSYLNVNRLNQADIRVQVKACGRYPGRAVSAVCPFGLSSLVICTGKELKLVHLDVSTRRWSHIADFGLPSKAVKLQAKGNVVHVATELHSFMLVRVQEDRFSLVSSDRWAGKTRSIVPFGTNSSLINLVSSEGSRLLGYSERPTKGVVPLFEARVPQAIDRLMRLSETGTSERERFIATSIDGTISLFTIVRGDELTLLKFLEQLCQPPRTTIATQMRGLALRVMQKHSRMIEACNVTPQETGFTQAHGDTLEHMLEIGPYNLRSLMQRTIKLEDQAIKEESEEEKLQDAALPVIGTCPDVIDGVVLWLRQLLSVPVF